MSITRFTVAYNSVVDPGSICSNPSISVTNPVGLTIPCQDDDSVDIEINTDVSGPYCLTFVINCNDTCSTCPPIIVTKCFCIDPDDCGDCENCTGNLCVSTCAAGKICDNDTCVDCTVDSECLCNQECSQGKCKCEGGLKKRADGCCVECFDDEDLGPCRVCIEGVITATICPNGYCNPETGDCQECYNNTHCTGPNECCTGAGVCDCCPGYILDPETNQCVEQPECLNAQDCIDQFGKCYYCTEDGCAPIVCPNGQVCDPNTGNCVNGCENGTCPEGSGCLNGRCIPCDELSCLGTGELCEYAAGCHCVVSACEYIDCNPDSVDLDWVVTTGTPGTLRPGTGLAALQGTTSITPTGIITLQPPTGASYQNHQFSLGVNGTNGAWTLYHTPTTSVALGSGTSVVFDLAGTAPSNGPNLVGFIVKFVETGTGRTATWGFYRTPTAPLTAPDVWNSEFQSTGTPASSTGGTSGSVQLCATNGNFIPTGVTNVTTTGDINITFFATGGNCLTAVITGCGTWNGDVVLSCGGTTVTVPAPEFTKDPSNCCEPTDPNCNGWGDGDPCGDLTIQPITLVALPTYGLSGSGDGEFLIVADWNSAGLTFIQMFYLNPSVGCWSTSANAGVNDVQIVTSNSQSPFGPSVSALSVIATLGDGGCVRLGYTCELAIAGCKKLQGEVCLTQCQAFTVDIIQVDTYTFSAAPSLSDEAVTYTWTYPGLVNNTGQTVTIVPQGGATTLTVTAKYGSPVKCTATDSITFNISFPGCTNRQACNYDSTATTDDGSCVLVGNPSYDCVLGGFQPGFIDATSINTPTIQWKLGGNVIATNSQIAPGTHTIDLFFNGIQECSRTLVVPQCYRCNASEVCVPAPSGDNVGLYSSSDCNGECACNIEVNITQSTCITNRSSMTITATGDTGSYIVTVTNVATGAQVLAPTAMNTSGSVTTSLLCRGTYRVLVTGANCDKSRDYFVNCNDCDQNTAALSAISYDCGTNQLFYTIASDACTTSYNVRLLNSSLVVKSNETHTTTGPKTAPLGVYPGDGIYTVRLTANGCTKDYTLALNCNGTNEDCAILGWDTSDPDINLSYVDDGTDVSFTVSFVLNPGAGTYTVGLYTTTGGSPTTCSGSVLGTLITSTQVVGALGINTVNFPDAVSTPGITTCYGAKVTRNSNPNCTVTDFVSVSPSSSAPPNCSGSITNLSYNTNTGEVLASWDFEDTSNDMTVEMRVSASPCNAADPIVVSVSGNGEDGINIPFGPIHQLQGTTQCVTVTVYDSNDPSCSATDTIEIPACNCEIIIDDSETIVDDENQTMEVTYTTKCTSGNITIDISGDASGSSSDSTASQTGVTVENTKVIALTGYPSTGGSVVLEIIDDVDGSCSDTQTVSLSESCVGCGQISTLGFLTNGVLTSVVDADGNTLVTGSYSTVSDNETFEDDLQTALASGGANFCSTDTPVDMAVQTSGCSPDCIVNRGVLVTQDSDDNIILNYAVVESIYYAGGKKVYFGNCGCSNTRTCDFTSTVDIGTDDTFVRISYGTNNLSQGYADYWEHQLSAPRTFTPSDIVSIQNSLRSQLLADGCGYTVGTITATYNSGTFQLTISVEGTNVGLGLLYSVDSPGPGINNVEEFTQSNCS